MKVQALGVGVAIPECHADGYIGFASHRGPADVELDQLDPALLSGDFTRAVVDRTKLLTVHAAVVHCPKGVIVVPGASGLGKSTLTVALLQAGFDLMSDEVFAVDRGAALARSFPRPITLNATSRLVLGLPADGRPGEESALPPPPPDRIGPSSAPIVAIVLADRTGAGETQIGEAAPRDAVAALMACSFNHFRDPVSTFAIVSGLARTSAVLRARYSNAVDFAAELALRLLPDREVGPSLVLRTHRDR